MCSLLSCNGFLPSHTNYYLQWLYSICSYIFFPSLCMLKCTTVHRVQSSSCCYSLVFLLPLDFTKAGKQAGDAWEPVPVASLFRNRVIWLLFVPDAFILSRFAGKCHRMLSLGLVFCNFFLSDHLTLTCISSEPNVHPDSMCFWRVQQYTMCLHVYYPHKSPVLFMLWSASSFIF